jgi:hypothetical protein
MLLDELTAELTRTVYQVALRHQTGGTWLDLELDLWRAVSDAVKMARSRERSLMLNSIA